MISTQPETVQKTSKKSLNSSGAAPSKSSVKIPSKQPLLRGAQRSVFSGLDFRAIKRWVAMEERIVQGEQSREKESVAVKTAILSPKPSTIDKATKTDLKPPKKSSNSKANFPWSRLFFSAAFFVALIFAAIYVKTMIAQDDKQGVAVLLPPGIEQQTGMPSGQVLTAKQKELETLASNQQEAIRDLKKEINRLNQKVRSGQAGAQTLASSEGDYRDELYQMTLQYEQSLAALRQANQGYEQDLAALRQANQGMEGLIRDLRSNLQDSQVALESTRQASAAVQAAQASASSRPSRFQYEASPRAAAVSRGIRGKAIMINSRYQFVIISLGAQKGIRNGQRVTFYKDKKEFAAGRIERVFPTLSGVAVFDATVLDQIQEGDKIVVSGY